MIKRLVPKKRFLLFLTLLLTSLFDQSWAVEISDFRTWNTQDGLEENYSIDLSTGPDGKVWVRHGYVPNITSFDGQEFTTIPVPGKTTPVSLKERELFEIREHPSGIIWGSRADAIYQNKNETWQRYALPSDIGDSYTYGPIDERRVLILLPDRLLEFDIESNTSRVVKIASDTALKKFNDLTFDREKGYWITGERGIAKATFTPENPDATRYHWEEFTEALNVNNESEINFNDYKSPVVGTNGEVYAVALLTSSDETFLLKCDGSTLEVIYNEAAISVGWIDSDGGMWIVVYEILYYFSERLTRNDWRAYYIEIPLLGSVKDIETTKDGVFWIATDQGLVSYMPPLWRTPAGIETNFLRAQSMYETSDGTLWVSSRTELEAFSKGRWRSYKLPDGYEIPPEVTANISLLPDGRLAFSVVSDPETTAFKQHLMIFDPTSGIFELKKASRGKRFLGITQLSDGPNIVPLGSAERFSLNTFDGEAFHTILEESDWGIGELRSPFIARNGNIWLGGMDGLGVYSDGEYKRITSEDGFTESGGFAIHELENGTIWVGGRKRIVAFDGQEWTNVKEIGGAVRSMMTAKNGDIWVSTDAGLYRYAQGFWIRYSEEDGLPSLTAWSTFEDSQGRIWSATEYGPSLFYPDVDTHAPDTHIPSDLNSDNIREGDPLNLTFEGVDKWGNTPSDRIHYSFRLDEGEWSANSAANSVLMEDLAAGLHQVEVRAIDQNMNVDPTPAIFSFEVQPTPPTPIQDRTWFIPALIALTILMGLLVLAVSNARKKLAKTVNNLEETVQVRTAELRADIAMRELVEEKRSKLEQQLLQAQKMDSLGTLAGGIAHDFNNILQAILGYTKMAQENKNGNAEKLDRYLKEIEKSGHRAADLVEQILTFSRKTDVKTEILIVPPLIEEALKFIRSSIPSTIRIESDIDHSAAHIAANATQFHQVVTNLCTNAMHAMEEEGGTLSVALKGLSLDSPIETLNGQLKPGDYIQLSISDTGIGIDPEAMHEILDPFFTTKDVGKGTGLGLAVTHGIVSAMAGGLTIKSEVGKGTTVLVTLPVAMESEVDELSNIHPKPQLRGKGHIMLVDDEEVITELATLMLENQGFTVDVFNDGSSAIEGAKENPRNYNLALLDYTMPGMTGIELATELETLIPGLPVVIATGKLDKSALDQSNSKNIEEIIQKPYSSIELLAAINRGLNQ